MKAVHGHDFLIFLCFRLGLHVTLKYITIHAEKKGSRSQQLSRQVTTANNRRSGGDTTTGEQGKTIDRSTYM